MKLLLSLTALAVALGQNCAPSNNDWGCCSSSSPCGAGLGDCDSDGDCSTGYCAHNVGANYGGGSNFDVCEYSNACNPGNEDWGCCYGQCLAGEGDCDSDSDCATGLCSHDVGANYGAVSSFDVCETAVRNCTPANEDWSCCDATNPCADEEGDCDSDSECQTDMVCTHNVGTEYGITSSFDVCRVDPCRSMDGQKGRKACKKFTDSNGAKTCVSVKMVQGQFNGGATCNYKKCFFCLTKACALENKKKKCNKDPNCGWNPSTMACEDGYVLSCSDFNKRKQCSAKTGCMWTGGACSAGVLGCSDRNSKKKCQATTFVSNNQDIACKWKAKVCMEDNDYICSANSQSANQCNKVPVGCKYNNGVCVDN